MSLNTANTPDGRGVLIFNGEMILLYVKTVNLSFEAQNHGEFKGKHQGNLYLTSHRIIFISSQSGNTNFRSLSMPFHTLRNVKLEQPILGANYLQGGVGAEPSGNWGGEGTWKLTFNKGGCIEFGQALLKANDMANSYRPHDAPPQYAPPAGGFFSPPPAYYIPPGGNYNGFQAPVHAFPDQPPAQNVFMYEQPPPYPGIGPNRAPHQVNPYNSAEGQPLLYPNVNANGQPAPNPSAPPPYPASQAPYGEAGPLPPKV